MGRVLGFRVEGFIRVWGLGVSDLWLVVNRTIRRANWVVVEHWAAKMEELLGKRRVVECAIGPGPPCTVCVGLPSHTTLPMGFS